MVSSTLAVAMNSTRLQVEGHAQVVVAERIVLLGIEHFQQRRRRDRPCTPAPSLSISSSIMTQIARAGLADGLNDVARQRADVGAPMPADFRLVMHAAQAHAHELATQGSAIDWPSEVLPTPGGPTKHRIGALPCGASLRTARYSMMRRLIFSSP